MKTKRQLLANAEPLPSNGQFYGVDLIKFICAYLICMIHINPFVSGTEPNDTLNMLIRCGICRVAVPFYFAATGFFLFRAARPNYPVEGERIKKTCFKLFRLLGTWTFLLVVGGHHQLWYLGAAALAVILMNLLFKYVKSLKLIALICGVLYLIGLLGDTYRGLLAPLTKHLPFQLPYTRNAFFMGLVFVFIGVLVARSYPNIPLKIAAVGLVISVILLYIEVVLQLVFGDPAYFKNGFNMCVSHLPLTYFLMVFAVNLRFPRCKHPGVFKKLRVYGVLIYFTHLLVSAACEKVINGVGKFLGRDIRPLRILMVFAGATLIAIVIEYLSRREKLRWLRYLYS